VTAEDNLEEFADAALYDAENPWAADDDFYLAVALHNGGPVLDLACGTGRLTRALAARGLSITGIDLAQPMLERARMLARQANLRVEWVEADCRRFDLGRHFALALMTGHAFQALLTEADQRACLARVAAHLEPGARFAFELRNPKAGAVERNHHAYTVPVQDLHGRWIDRSIASRYDPQTQIEDVTRRRTMRDTGQTATTHIRLKYTTAEALDRLLAEAGFTVEARYGDWSRAPFTEDSIEIITVARLTSRAVTGTRAA
jgi:ubiquinone/menaquinone biosynthesis C-methylase UbiE